MKKKIIKENPSKCLECFKIHIIVNDNKKMSNKLVFGQAFDQP